MSVAIRKIDGVESVEVSLNQGVANVKLQAGNRVSPEQIRDVARDNGFTPKDAEVEAVGRIEHREGKRVLALAGSDLVFLLEDHPDAQGTLDEFEATDEEVIVAGRIPETATAPPGKPLALQVRGIRRAR